MQLSEISSLLQLQVNFDKKTGNCLKILFLYSYLWKMNLICFIARKLDLPIKTASSFNFI